MAPSIVFVPGAWHAPEYWSKVTDLLDFKCVCPALATTTGAGGFKDDIDAVRSTIERELSAQQNVVVVVHSYGSMPGSSALKGLTSGAARVIGFIAITTGFPETGVAFLDHWDGNPPPIWKIENGLVEVTVPPQELFYHDVPDAQEWIGKLTQQSVGAFYGGEHAYAGWKEVPVWYIAATEDKALPVQMQREYVKQAQAQTQSGITLREVQSSHSPMLSKPQEVADIIKEAVASFDS
jgi:pimeloyl-ACP methyl ester carboxylesterase